MALKVLSSSAEGDRHGCNVSSVVCLTEGVASGSDDGKIKIWKPDLGLVSEMEAPGGILSMAVCGHTLYTCSADESIEAWDLGGMRSAGRVATTLRGPQKLFVDGARRLWAGDSQGNVARFENGKECGKFELVEEIWDLMVSTGPDLVYTARDRDVVVAEVVTGGERTRVMVRATLQGRSPLCVVGEYLCFLSRDGRSLLVHENSAERKFPRVREVAASEVIVNAVAGAVAGAGGAVVYSGGYDSGVRKWDVGAGECLGAVDLGCCVNALACRSEDEVYVAKADGGVVRVGC